MKKWVTVEIEDYNKQISLEIEIYLHYSINEELDFDGFYISSAIIMGAEFEPSEEFSEMIKDYMLGDDMMMNFLTSN